MKNIFLIIILFIFVSPLNGQYQDLIIQTPRGVTVDARRFIGTDYSEPEIEYWNYYWTNGYNCRILANSTNYYNCHGYAWYNIEGRMDQIDQLWINDVDQYGNPIYNVTKYYSGVDPSYTQVSTVTNHLKVSYYPRDHSALTTEHQDSVISKWAYGPLVKHKLASCPFYQNAQIKYYKLNPGINGTETALCESVERSFTSNTSIPGSTYTWSKEDNLLEEVINSGTSYRVRGKTSSGKAWLRLQITTPSGEIATTGYKYVWVGKPVVNSVSGPYPPEGCPNTSYAFCVSPTMEPIAQATYSWSTNPSNSYIYPYYNDYCAAITFYAPHPGYRVRATAGNTCGTAYAETSMFIGECKNFMLFPNPASDNITITKIASTETNTFEKDLKQDDGIYTIRIIDLFGALHYSATKTGDSFTLPVSNLKNGNYIIQVINGENISNLQLIIKH